MPEAVHTVVVLLTTKHHNHMLVLGLSGGQATDEPDAFVERFVPLLRSAIQHVGWATVRESLKEYLAP